MNGVKVSFVCQKHGILHGKVIYVNFRFQSRTVNDLPCKYCDYCDSYYTPFGNIIRAFEIKDINNKSIRICNSTSQYKEMVKRPFISINYKIKQITNQILVF